MIDDREAQAAVLARTRANPACDINLAPGIQDRIAIHRRTHGDEAAYRLAAAYRRLPETKRHRTQPEQALRLLERHEADQADQRWYAEINGLEHEPPAFGE